PRVASHFRWRARLGSNRHDANERCPVAVKAPPDFVGLHADRDDVVAACERGEFRVSNRHNSKLGAPDHTSTLTCAGGARGWPPPFGLPPRSCESAQASSVNNPPRPTCAL